MRKGSKQSPEAKEKNRIAHLGKRAWNKDAKNPLWLRDSNPRWNGGMKIQQGYRLISSPLHPRRNKQGYVPEHRLVMESMAGRFLEKDEIVHHLDHNKQNNTPENLVITTRAEHKKLHHPDIGIDTRFKKGTRQYAAQ